MKGIPVSNAAAGVTATIVPDGISSLIAVNAAGIASSTDLSKVQIYVSTDPSDTAAKIQQGICKGLLCIADQIFPSIPVIPGEKVYVLFANQGSAMLYYD